MTSFNHYALGAVADWLHRTVAGLAPGKPGYRDLRIQPHPGAGLTHAKATHYTPYGPASCAWQIAGETITVEVEVPPNTRAHVCLPGKEQEEPLEVGSGTHLWSYPYQAPGTVCEPLTLDSTIGELIEHEEAFAMVMRVLPKRITELTDNLLAHEHVTLRDSLKFLPQSEELLATVAEALAKLNR